MLKKIICLILLYLCISCSNNNNTSRLIEDRNTHGWTEYHYYVWGDYDKGIWISIFDDSDGCIFVGKPRDLLKKYYQG